MGEAPSHHTPLKAGLTRSRAWRAGPAESGAVRLLLTDPSDVQAMFDNIPVAEKKLQWIDGTTARWDGYMEFQRRPQPMLDWFARYMS
jgi:hypothetical protein